MRYSIISFLLFFLLSSCTKNDDNSTTSKPIDLKYTLTVSSSEGGTVSNSGGSFQSGTKVSITATPSEGYRFLNWSDGVTDITREILINSNISITAQFEELFYKMSKNTLMIDQLGDFPDNLRGMIGHNSISGSFQYTHNNNQYLFISGGSCANNQCDGASSSRDVEPTSSLHFKKTSEGWRLLKVYDNVKTWGIRNFKIIGNYIAMGDGNEIGTNNWRGHMWYGEIMGDEINWTRVTSDSEQRWFHGTTLGDLNNDGLLDIGGAPGEWIEGDFCPECGQWDGTNGGMEFNIFMQKQSGVFTKESLIKYPRYEVGTPIFSNSHFTIEFENIDDDPLDEILVSSYKDNSEYQDDEWRKYNTNNLVVYKYNQESSKFELLWNSTTPYVFYPSKGNNENHGSTSIKVYDFNNDGIKDISVAREYLNDLSFDIWIGKGDGSFEPYSHVSTELDISFREFSIMDVDNDGDGDIVFKSNFGYFSKNGITTDFGLYDWNITRPYQDPTQPDSEWKGIILNELIWINDGSGKFEMYDKKNLYIKGILPQQLIPYKKNEKFYFVGFRGYDYNNSNQLESEFYDIEVDLE